MEPISGVRVPFAMARPSGSATQIVECSKYIFPDTCSQKARAIDLFDRARSICNRAGACQAKCWSATPKL